MTILKEGGNMDAAVSAAREKLKNVTPLKRDCGRICGARCCRPLDGEETGMLLFPTEAEAYEGKDGWEIRKTARGEMILCPGRCDREERPLSCRLFPLLPLAGENDGIRVVTDRRAKAVCPLARQGKSAMDPAFTDAVREAGKLLLQSDGQAMFLEMLEEEQEELKELQRAFRG
jgi:hypothetical protein